MEQFRRDLCQLWDGLQMQNNSPSPDDDDENNHPASIRMDPKKMIILQAGRALTAWMVVYVVFFLLLLGYKWQTRNYYQADYERTLAEVQKRGHSFENASATVAVVNPRWKVQAFMVEEAVNGIRELTNLQDGELKLIEQERSRVQQMKQRLEQLEFSSSISSSPPGKGKETKEAPLGKSLDSLLQLATLNEIPSSVLNDLFEQAMADLRDVLKSADETFSDWATLHARLSVEYPPKQGSAENGVVGLECPPSSTRAHIEETDGTNGPLIPEAGVARESDLEEMILAIEALLLEKRSNNVKREQGLLAIVSPQTAGALEASTRPRIQNILGSIVKEASSFAEKKSSRRTGSSPCLNREDVLAIVDEGLLALQRHANLRNTLRKKAIELDPTTSSIILDADLPLPTHKVPHRETINLARVLDTPLVQEVAQGIDQLIEMGGGYNDRLDQWLDSVVGGRESVGGMVVRKLLEESGKIEIPTLKKVAEQHLPREAQELLKKAKVL